MENKDRQGLCPSIADCGQSGCQGFCIPKTPPSPAIEPIERPPSVYSNSTHEEMIDKILSI